MDTDEYKAAIKREARIVAMEIVKDFMQFVDLKMVDPVMLVKAFEDSDIGNLFDVNKSDTKSACYLGAAISLYEIYLKTFPFKDQDGLMRFMEKLTIQRVGKRNEGGSNLNSN